MPSTREKECHRTLSSQHLDPGQSIEGYGCTPVINSSVITIINDLQLQVTHGIHQSHGNWFSNQIDTYDEQFVS